VATMGSPKGDWKYPNAIMHDTYASLTLVF